MVKYTCFDCSKKIGTESMGKRVRCPYCGIKMLYKTPTQSRYVKAR